MNIVTMTSDKAHREWRELLDRAYMGNQEVVIERSSKPIVVIVNYEQWQKAQERLEELELLLAVRQAKARAASGASGSIAYDDLKRLLLERHNQGAAVHVGT